NTFHRNCIQADLWNDYAREEIVSSELRRAGNVGGCRLFLPLCLQGLLAAVHPPVLAPNIRQQSDSYHDQQNGKRPPAPPLGQMARNTQLLHPLHAILDAKWAQAATWLWSVTSRAGHVRLVIHAGTTQSESHHGLPGPLSHLGKHMAGYSSSG